MKTIKWIGRKELWKSFFSVMATILIVGLFFVALDGLFYLGKQVLGM